MAFPEGAIKIATSIVGKLNKHRSKTGYTLIELIVVLGIICIVFSFTVPEFSRNLLGDDIELAVNRIVLNAAKLKKESRSREEDLVLCIQEDSRTIRIGKNTVNHSETEENETIAEYNLPESVSIEDVEFSHRGPEKIQPPCIRFFSKGYSDHAVIHVSSSDGRRVSILIQPFLQKVTVHDGFIQIDRN